MGCSRLLPTVPEPATYVYQRRMIGEEAGRGADGFFPPLKHLERSSNHLFGHTAWLSHRRFPSQPLSGSLPQLPRQAAASNS